MYRRRQEEEEPHQPGKTFKYCRCFKCKQMREMGVQASYPHGEVAGYGHHHQHLEEDELRLSDMGTTVGQTGRSYEIHLGEQNESCGAAHDGPKYQIYVDPQSQGGSPQPYLQPQPTISMCTPPPVRSRPTTPTGPSPYLQPQPSVQSLVYAQPYIQLSTSPQQPMGHALGHVQPVTLVQSRPASPQPQIILSQPPSPQPQMVLVQPVSPQQPVLISQPSPSIQVQAQPEVQPYRPSSPTTVVQSAEDTGPPETKKTLTTRTYMGSERTIPSRIYQDGDRERAMYTKDAMHDGNEMGKIQMSDKCMECLSSQEQMMQFQRRSKTITISREVFLLIEFILGLIVFAVEVYFEVCTLYVRYYSYNYLHSNIRRELVIVRLIYTTVTAFPFIVLPVLGIIVLTRMKSRESSFRLLLILICLVAFFMYVSSGIVVITSPNHRWVPTTAKQVFGVLCIITGVVYLIHILYEVIKGKDIPSKRDLMKKNWARQQKREEQYQLVHRRIHDACKDVCY